ncbi:MAG: sensor histidine kinase [Oligoflexales bacterium]
MLKTQSIFFKLLLVLLGMGLLVNLVVFYGFKLSFDDDDFFRQAGFKNLKQYLHYLMDDIGDPPSEYKLKRLANDIGLEIRIHGNGLKLTSKQGLPQVVELEKHHMRHKFRPKGLPGIQGYFEGYFFSVHERGAYQYVFFLDGSLERRELREWVLVLSLVLLSGLIFVSYLILRKLLHPIKDLDIAVKEVSRGKLDTTLTVKGKGELASLTQGFNNMLESLSNTIHAKQQLVVDVSHELRTPLTRIKVALEMLPEQKAKHLVQQDILVMEEMISLILDQARYAAGTVKLDIRKVNLVELLRRVVAEFHSDRLVYQQIPEKLEIDSDDKHLGIVFRNIITNALKYSEELGEDVLLNLGLVDGKVEFTCEDRGIGIASKNLSKVFEPFFRVDPSRQRKTGGFGLGLAMVKRILDSLGAQIEISSKQGIGTKVRVIL